MRTSFGRVVSESLPKTNLSNLSTPFSSRWVSFWKDPLLNTIDPVLGTSADQERKELLPRIVKEVTVSKVWPSKVIMVKSSPEMMMEDSFSQVPR